MRAWRCFKNHLNPQIHPTGSSLNGTPFSGEFKHVQTSSKCMGNFCGISLIENELFGLAISWLPVPCAGFFSYDIRTWLHDTCVPSDTICSLTFFRRHLIIPNWYWTVVFVLEKWRHDLSGHCSDSSLHWAAQYLSALKFHSYSGRLLSSQGQHFVSLENPLSKSRLLILTSDDGQLFWESDVYHSIL